MNLNEVLHYRRSVRAYDRTKLIDPERIKHYLELATLAPNSSDMQLWEFYHITQPELLAKVSRACLDQKATSTASQYSCFRGARISGTGNMRGLYLTSSGEYPALQSERRQAKRVQKPGIMLWQIDAVCLCPVFLWNFGIIQKTTR